MLTSATKKPTPRRTAAARKPAAKKAAPAVKKPAAKKAPEAPQKTKPAKKSAPKKGVASLQEQWRDTARKVIDTNKGEDISILDLKGKCSFADFMIVASGRSARHVSSMADHVVDALRKDGGMVLSVEGQDTGDWVLIDAGDIVIHLFRPEVRQFYNIEKMWAIPLTAD